MKKWLVFISSFFIFSISKGQTDIDTLLARKYMDRIAVVMEDESKEDSIFILAKAASEMYLAQGLFTDFVKTATPYIREIWQDGYLDAALLVLNDYIETAQTSVPTQHLLQASLYYEIALCYYNYGQYPIALPYLRQGIEQRRKAGFYESTDGANDYNLLGLLYQTAGDIDAAKENLERALSIFSSHLGPDTYEASKALNNLGALYQQNGLLNRALSYYQKAYVIRERQLGIDNLATANVILNIGVVAKDKGEYQKSIEYLEQALAIFIKNSGTANRRVGEIYYNLGIVYFETGSLTEAEIYLQNALQIFRKLPQKAINREALVLRGLANLNANQKEYEKAILLRQNVLSLQKQLYEPSHPELAITYDNIGVDQRDLGQIDSSLYYHQKAIKILETTQEYKAELANVENNLADSYLRKKEVGKALEAVNTALHLQQQLLGDRHAAIAYSYNSLSKIASLQGQYQQALEYAHTAIMANHESFAAMKNLLETPVDGYFRYDYYFESIMQKASAFRFLGQKKEALQQYQFADEILAQAKSKLISREDKINQSQRVNVLTQAAIEICYELAKEEKNAVLLEQAFYFAEKSKASVLLQSISANNAKQFAGIPDSLLALEEQLQSDISYYSLQLVDRPDSTKIPLFQAELFEARQMHKKLISRFEEDFPIYYELKYASQIPRVKAVQFGLPEKTAMVSYFTGDSVLYAFYVSKNDYQVFSTPLSLNAFSKRVNAFTKGAKSTSQSLGRVFVSTGQALYQQVFPFPIPESIKQLVIIPDGQLTKIPFEALLTTKVDTKAAINFSTLPYLINDFDINYTPSASLYYQSQTNTQQNTYANNAELVAFAPVFSNEEPLSPSTQRFLKNNGDHERAFTKDGTYISPLPGTAVELEAISQVFADNNLSTTNFTYQQATEAQIKSQLVQECRYLHIATHGFINEDYPDLSGLLFATDTSSLENAILASGEVYGLQLKANLVVLSACETGKGKITSGEGVLGLSRAFLYAGADNLIVSLWKVDDRATAELMAAFYKTHLKKSRDRLPFKEALRQAKLQLIQSKEFSQPYYWSAFVLIGE